MTLDYDRLACDYARYRQVHPRVLQELIGRGRLSRSSRVLDIGCGTGNYLAALERSVDCAAWGIEPSAAMLTTAHGRTRYSLQAGYADALPYVDRFFDLAFSVDVIHHVHDRAGFYREAYRVVRPGGRVCTITDSDEIIAQRQPLSTCFPETIPVEMERYPRISDLREMMAQAGFRELMSQTVEFEYPLGDVQMFKAKAFSCLHLISAEAFERGIREMERQLAVGPVQCVSRYVMLWGVRASGIQTI